MRGKFYALMRTRACRPVHLGRDTSESARIGCEHVRVDLGGTTQPNDQGAHKCAYTARVEWTPAKIRALRSERGWTQARLADELGASTRAVNGWENTGPRPAPWLAARLDQLAAAPAGTEPVRRVDPIRGLGNAELTERLLELQAELAVVTNEVLRRHTEATEIARHSRVRGGVVPEDLHLRPGLLRGPATDDDEDAGITGPTRLTDRTDSAGSSGSAGDVQS